MFVQTEELVLKLHLALNCAKSVLSGSNAKMNKYTTLTSLRETEQELACTQNRSLLGCGEDASNCGGSIKLSRERKDGLVFQWSSLWRNWGLVLSRICQPPWVCLSVPCLFVYHNCNEMMGIGRRHPSLPGSWWESSLNGTGSSFSEVQHTWQICCQQPAQASSLPWARQALQLGTSVVSRKQWDCISKRHLMEKAISSRQK